MPVPAHLIVFGPGKKPLAGPIPLQDVEINGLSGSEIHEFIHRVYTIKKDYRYQLLYGVDFIRKHEPLCITKPIDKLSAPLMGYLLKGAFLPQIEIRWYEYDNPAWRGRKETEYFRMTLEHVRLNSIRTMLPDAKDPAKERYGHLEAVTFCYQKITWLYKKGYILHTDIWNGGFFGEEDEKDFSAKRDEEREAAGSVIENLISLFKVTFTEGIFIKPEKGFAFDAKTKVRFSSAVNRRPDMKEGKVFAKLYTVYNDRTEDMHQIQEGRLREDGSWETEFTLRKPQSWEKDKNRRPDAQVEYYSEIENKYADGNFRSESIRLPETEEEIVVPWFIDVHAHVQSTDCAPKPLVRGHLKGLSIGGIAGLAGKMLPGFAGTPGVIFSKSTEENASKLMKKSEAVLNEKNLKLMGDVKNRHRVVINMPMDMDFGHYKGYEGKKIYEHDEEGYWELRVGKERKKITKRVYDKWVDYVKQIKEIQNAFLKGNGEFISFFHYDPRRWGFEKYDYDNLIGKWDDPFCCILQTLTDDQVASSPLKFKLDRIWLNPINISAIGFKMYTALGYRPDDFSRLPHLLQFYKKCSEPDLDIPIICHGSRGGMHACDWRYYYQQHIGNDKFDDDEAREWYTREFISPHAWEKVLQKFPNLKLCLAHFGGEECWGKQRASQKVDWFEKLVELMRSKKYPNVYVDISYFLFDDKIIDQFADAVKDETIRKKILFGTDWYLMEQEWTKIGLFATYKHYFERVYKGLQNDTLKKIDKTLAAQITVLNPLKFLGLKKLTPKIELLRETMGKSESSLSTWINDIPDSADDFPRMMK
ncbi:MAG: type VI secretion system tube protein Hcp [Chitinispirillaceae bacterium]|nr:type VI secretion system tube protein Hcp [Chitinispirillaceae bacterium]